MFGWIRRFWHRHRTKLFVTGAVIGGAVLLGKYASWKLNELREQEAVEYLSLTRRQHHFDSNQRTCNMTVLSMIPNLKEILMQLLDSENLTAQLKNKPTNRVEIWEELKIISFTRTIVAVYSSCMLVVLLRIQLNIIGGYMYLDGMSSQDMFQSTDQKLPPEIQQRYLATIQYLLEQGLKDFITSVRSAVEAVLTCVSLKHCISTHEVTAMINKVRSLIETEKTEQFDSAHSLCKYMLPSEATVMQENGIIHQLMIETKDMLESDDCSNIINLCLKTGFNRLEDNIQQFYNPVDVTNENNLQYLNIPLAKIIPVMNGQIHSICSDTPNHFVQELLLLQPVKDFAANIYEAFSQSASASIAP
ncbi:peroxisomal biogenesis factor 3-like [Saccoglossus kowalevskii]|uniref:Peroxisomal biogenesis factor 3 n=1 Tax=Saccoglossus kowalevskii TaxID=10224 RepID=A0ABM0MMJ3_SACKO|nr:PREDICTED: peroxisomal biogenesis factor 3-like [Saccoglossus kowalevskii]